MKCAAGSFLGPSMGTSNAWECHAHIFVGLKHLNVSGMPKRTWGVAPCKRASRVFVLVASRIPPLAPPFEGGGFHRLKCNWHVPLSHELLLNFALMR
jgi:hypothetical protein